MLAVSEITRLLLHIIATLICIRRHMIYGNPIGWSSYFLSFSVDDRSVRQSLIPCLTSRKLGTSSVASSNALITSPLIALESLGFK